MTDTQIVSMIAAAIPVAAGVAYLVGYWQGARFAIQRMSEPNAPDVAPSTES